MGHRKELKNIAGGIISSFVSRNNDVDGYWELGKLYKSFGENEVTLDILAESIQPRSDEFGPLLKLWNLKLNQRLESRKIPVEWICSAKIKVKFNSEFIYRLHHWGSALGDACTCVCEIVADNGRCYSVIAGTNCRPHNPEKETRSTRRH